MSARRGRVEDFRLVSGAGQFIGDMQRVDALHAVFVRAAPAHALICEIDIEAARRMPGVAGVFTAADGVGGTLGETTLRRTGGTASLNNLRPALAGERVRYAGEAVALVVADTMAAAMEAAERVRAEYDLLPSTATSAQAVAAGAQPVWPDAPDNIAFLWEHGEPAAVDDTFAGAAHITRLSLDISRVTACSMEPRGLLVVPEEGRLVVHASHQSPYALRDGLARALELPPAAVRVIAADVGGSFGLKNAVHPEDVAVAWAARRLGRPVRWLCERGEAFLSDDHGRDAVAQADLALDRQGRFLGLRARFDCNIGAYLSGRSVSMVMNIGGVAGVYRIPLIHAAVRGIYSNTVTIAAYRGAGRPEVTYTLERLIDVAAQEMGIDAFDLRRRNLIPAEAMPFKTALTFTYDSGDFAANMETAAQLADIAGFSLRRDEAAARGMLRGLGMANPIELAGGPIAKPLKDSAFVTLGRDGTVTVCGGIMSTGQGHETAVAELVAARLGVPPGRVRYRQGDTDQLAAGGRGPGGSSGLCVGGSAALLAVAKVLRRAEAIAADMLEVSTVDIEYAHGQWTVVGTDRSVTLQGVACAVADDAVLGEGAEFAPGAATFPNGCHVCEVEIDPETGGVALQRYCAVEDVGRVLDSVLVHGQMHGGLAQGIGQALGEKIAYDGESTQLLSGSFMDYHMPRAADLVPMTLATKEVPTSVNPLGVKGVGEAGTVGALAATMNAVCNALLTAGVRHFDMPASPHRVWAALAVSRQPQNSRPSSA